MQVLTHFEIDGLRALLEKTHIEHDEPVRLLVTSTQQLLPSPLTQTGKPNQMHRVPTTYTSNGERLFAVRSTHNPAKSSLDIS